MGNIHHGIPPKLALDLRHKFGLKCFVETGTLVGKTAQWASTHFEKVYTVEISYNLYVLALKNLEGFSNIEIIYGESQTVLAGIMPQLSEPTLFWLDAHWSRDLGYPKMDAAICPVLEEIDAISESAHADVVLVDDFRLFGQEPGWPTKDTVKKSLESIDKIVTFSEDVFLAVPNGKD